MSNASLQFYRHGSVNLVPRQGSAPALIRWRLIAGNRRDLGRSAHLFTDIDEGLASLAAFRDGLKRATPRLELDLATAQWRWRLLVDDEVVAASTRGYARRVECQINLQQFSALVSDTVVDPQLRVFLFNGRPDNASQPRPADRWG